jgi:hypothetical protein
MNLRNLNFQLKMMLLLLCKQFLQYLAQTPLGKEKHTDYYEAFEVMYKMFKMML